MANVIHNQKIQSSMKSYAGQFGHRENALVTSNFTVLSMDSTAEVKARDGVSHVVADATAGAMQLTIPAPSQAKGRVIQVRKSQATNALTIVAKDGANVDGGASMAQTTVATIELFSTGTVWVRVG